MKTGRQRKRIAARSKGGEFQARRRKRRVYFCCLGSEIDVEKLADSLNGMAMKCKLYDEVLHVIVEPQASEMETYDNKHEPSVRENELGIIHELDMPLSSESNDIDYDIPNDMYIESDTNPYNPNPIIVVIPPTIDSEILPHSLSESYPLRNSIQENKRSPIRSHDTNTLRGLTIPSTETIQKVSTIHSQREVFVFGCGAVVFWGFPRGEELELLNIIRSHVEKGVLSEEEFQHGEDDLAFVTYSYPISEGDTITPVQQMDVINTLSAGSSSTTTDAILSSSNNMNNISSNSMISMGPISIANDVISVPENGPVKSRLAVSFAIAQSAVLAVFEARIERKIEEYKYIPETLAKNGKVKLSPKQLGTMIGEVFVIRHDVNLHSEILDKPDYFWKENEVEPMYRMCMQYLEMEPRTEILNKRLDLLRELLSVLQQQHENAHNVKLEW
eukprot:CAMPEP_0170059624 /NCGR_PEP_ID=MMETSP0019_2-20121128/1835_1 /TAXON_ID=98059 /ORGANISM="Dinobryon sp., Strain UTEXLB2267" /LENGTH=444 /DNA_ID=CAMNT_0010264927 /DNA_START=88 /DNA_END=1419 /DNA_ORIENTATION=-